MANVSHASLTGSEVHEPKGITGAPLGTVYVANGAGSGSWSSIGTSAFTGMVADFLAPVAPAGWLELDGSVISTTTYSALYGAMSITTSGTRTNGSPIVTSIPDTSNLRAGYFIFGTGISAGIVILSVDSASQITLSANASSSGSSAFAVSPWFMNTGTITLPNLTAAGRFRRSRTSSTKVGDVQADAYKSHGHGVAISATTDTGGGHQHAMYLNDPGHSHTYVTPAVAVAGTPNTNIYGSATTSTTSTNPTNITLGSVPGVANDFLTTFSGGHNHNVTVSGSTAATGDTETRPLSIVMLTCVKT